MSKLTVVYLKDTGHVLAALTRADPPAVGELVDALVYKSLPVAAVGSTAADFTVPVTDLNALTVDDNQPDVLINPQNFQVAQDPQSQTLQVVPGGILGSNVTLAIDTTSGATVDVTGVSTVTSLRALVVLEQVKPTSSAPIILPPFTLTVGTVTIVHDASGFGSSEKWNMYAFVQQLAPAAKVVSL